MDALFLLGCVGAAFVSVVAWRIAGPRHQMSSLFGIRRRHASLRHRRCRPGRDASLVQRPSGIADAARDAMRPLGIADAARDAMRPLELPSESL